MGPKYNQECPYKRKGGQVTLRGETDMNTEVEIGVMQPQNWEY